MILRFAHPSLLLLLVVPVLLVVWFRRRSGGEVPLPWDHTPRLPRARGWVRVLASSESLPAALLAVAILLLAGPQQEGEPTTKRGLTNIEFCVDVSGSMTAPFGNGSRYDAAMAAINDFLTYREGDAFGLTFFSDIALKWVPLTSDVSAFACAPPFMDPRKPLPDGLGGGTQIGQALMECRKTLMRRDEGDRMIILISDGASADLGGDRDGEIARAMTDEGITIFGVHIAEGGVPDSIVNVVANTGGEVFNPGEPDALRRVFQRIDQMRQAQLEKVTAETRDHFAPYCVAGLAVLATHVLTLFGLRYTPW